MQKVADFGLVLKLGILDNDYEIFDGILQSDKMPVKLIPITKVSQHAARPAAN